MINILLVALATFLLIEAGRLSLWLLNQPSDYALFGGIIVLLVFIWLYVKSIIYVWRKA